MIVLRIHWSFKRIDYYFMSIKKVQILYNKFKLSVTIVEVERETVFISRNEVYIQVLF